MSKIKRTHVFSLLCSKEELELWKFGAKISYQSLSHFVRKSLTLQTMILVYCAESAVLQKDVDRMLKIGNRLLLSEEKRKAGRPRRSFDRIEVEKALHGRSVRGAAKVMGVPQATLHRFIQQGGLEESKRS